MDPLPRNFVPFPAGWGAPVHADEHGGDDGWGDDGASASVSASADGWGAPSHSAPGQAAGDGWGAPAPGGWGTSSPAPGAGDEWSASGPPAHGWGQPPPQSNQLGMYNLSRGQGAKKGSARRNPPAQTSAAQAPVSLHPSQAVAMTSPQGWGAPSAPGWGEPAAAWGQPPAPKPPVAKPAWANWASEAKMVITPPSPFFIASFPPRSVAADSCIYKVLSSQQCDWVFNQLLRSLVYQTDCHLS